MFLFAAGLALLVVGAEFVIRGASRLALSLGVKPLILGITVVAIGTSAPELAVGITAAMQGSGDLAIGNIAGTNIFNILFILGLSAIILPVTLHLQIIKLELPVIILSALAMILVSLDGVLSPFDGLLMVLAAIGYTLLLIRLSRKESKAVENEFEDMYGEEPLEKAPGESEWRVRVINSMVLLTGLCITIYGADLLVDGSVKMARGLGITETIIGLTIVAIGTSAPEFATTMIATIRNERDVAVGNILGSSIYNILVILGVTAIASPDGISVESQVLYIDLPVVAFVALLCIPVFMSGKKVSRLEGCLFVGLYLAYLTSIIILRA